MPAEMQVLIRQIRRVAGRGDLAARSDRELLARFASDRDEDAFAALVSRHAGLVAGVCRRVLRNEHDVEDVFQATFLVLARKTGSVRWDESVAHWLHSVAYHLALRTRKTESRRLTLERTCSKLPSKTPEALPVRELKALLDQELARLPEASRKAIILCYLEARTRDQAARQCGWSVRTLDRRLEEGREILRARLTRRGLDLSVVFLATALAEEAKANGFPLASETVAFVMRRLSTSATTASSALQLANSALPGISGSVMRIVAGVVLAIALAGAGVGLSGQQAIKTDDSGFDQPTLIALPSQKEEKPRVAQPIVELAGKQKDEKARSLQQPVDLFEDPLPEGAVARLGGSRFRVSHPEMMPYSSDSAKLFAGNQQGVTNSMRHVFTRQLVNRDAEYSERSATRPNCRGWQIPETFGGHLSGARSGAPGLRVRMRKWSGSTDLSPGVCFGVGAELRSEYSASRFTDRSLPHHS